MISVVIPCHARKQNESEVGQQLWYTVASATSSLEASGFDYEIVVILNGEYPMTASLMHESSRVKAIFAGAQIDSPQSARNLGVRYTRGEFIFFLDAHVVVPPNFFSQIVSDMTESGADFMGTGHRYLGDQYFASRIAWEEFLWGRDTLNHPPNGADNLWMTAIHPHGAFCVRREAYLDAGGYWLALKGFGGEETQLCLKFWLMGKTVWATPRTYHWHWLPPGGRRGGELWKDPDLARNFLLIAAAYGDAERVKKSYDSLKILYWGNEDIFPMMQQNVLNCEETLAERKVVAEQGKFKSLAELRKYFNSNGVLN